MAVIDQFFGHPESAASIRFGNFFYPLRVFLINDQKHCPLRDLAIMTKKNGISGFQVCLMDEICGGPKNELCLFLSTLLGFFSG